MTLLQLSRNRLWAITGTNVRDQADRVYPIAIAVAGSIRAGLYKVVEVLRADWHRRWWAQ